MKKVALLTFLAIIVAMGFAQGTNVTVEVTTYSISQKNGKYGILKNDKEIILPYEYSKIFFIENVAVVAKGGTLIEETYGLLIQGTESYLINAKWALYDPNNGIFVSPFKYDFINNAGENLAAFNVGGQYVRQRKTQKEHDEYEYVLTGGLWGFIDCQTGKEIIDAQYESVQSFIDGMAMVSKNEVTTLLQNPLLSSDVDINIPVTDKKNEESFAFIFANQDYDKFTVPFAKNDGRIFREYCEKTLGFPEKNIRFYPNATIGNMMSAIDKIKDYADVYDGNASFVIYYSGQGMTDENTKIPYLLPVDAVLTNLSETGYSVEKLNRELSEISAKSTLLILDASFNGCDRDGNKLSAARGVALKPKLNYADGSLIVILASTGDETAYQYKDKNHGLFTYFLLKKLQETKGEISYKVLIDYVMTEVKKQSLPNDKLQSPNIIVSDKLINWQTLKIK